MDINSYRSNCVVQLANGERRSIQCVNPACDGGGTNPATRFIVEYENPYELYLSGWVCVWNTRFICPHCARREANVSRTE